jgi:hypothetical protein
MKGEQMVQGKKLEDWAKVAESLKKNTYNGMFYDIAADAIRQIGPFALCPMARKLPPTLSR